MKNFVLIIVATAIALLSVEGILRTLEPQRDKPISHVVETEVGSYPVPIPNAKRTVLGSPVSINELGYRGRPYPPQRSAGTFRILVFGDSHTFGSGAPDDQTYPAVMEKTLNKQKKRYEVLNFGVGGHDFGSIEKHMSLNVPKYSPDLVILTFHAGDIISTDVIIDLRVTRNTSPLVKLKRELISRSKVVKLVVLYGVPAVRSLFGIKPPGTTVGEIKEIEQNGPHWKNFKTEMLRLNNELQNRCIELAVVLFPSMIDFEITPAIKLHALSGSWLTENGIPVMDLLPVFQESNRKASELWATLLDHHPNAEGYTIAGEAAAGFVDSLVKSQNSETRSDCQNYVR